MRACAAEGAPPSAPRSPRGAPASSSHLRARSFPAGSDARTGGRRRAPRAAAGRPRSSRRPARRGVNAHTRHNPVNTLSWIRYSGPGRPSIRTLTSPSPSIGFMSASTSAGTAPRSAYGPATSVHGSQRTSFAWKSSKIVRARASAEASAAGGTSGIRNVLTSRGTARTSSASSAGCEPGPNIRSVTGTSVMASPLQCLSRGADASPWARTGIASPGARAGGAASSRAISLAYSSHVRRPSTAPM